MKPPSEYDPDGCRSLFEAILQQAVSDYLFVHALQDCQVISRHQRKRLTQIAEHGHPSEFFGGRWFYEICDLIDVVLDYRVNGKRSLVDVERRIQLHLTPFFGGRRMISITTTDVRDYTIARQAAGATSATINRELAIVKRAFRLSTQDRKLLHMPHIPMLREDNTRQGFFERDEFEAVRDELPANLRGIVTFTYYTGWRVPSEVLPLTWGQVDRENRTVRLEPGMTKNSEGRTLPYDLLPGLLDVVEHQWQEHERLAATGVLCPFVFHRNGKEIKGFRKAWTSACKAAGCPGKLLHDFRRTAVRNLVRANVPEKTAMGITGHKTRSVFDRYDIVDEADLRAALGMLADIKGTRKGQSAQSGRVAEFAPLARSAANTG